MSANESANTLLLTATEADVRRMTALDGSRQHLRDVVADARELDLHTRVLLLERREHRLEVLLLVARPLGDDRDVALHLARLRLALVPAGRSARCGQRQHQRGERRDVEPIPLHPTAPFATSLKIPSPVSGSKKWSSLVSTATSAASRSFTRERAPKRPTSVATASCFS